MTPKQWNILQQCAQGLSPGHLPVALIVDSPWIPGYLGLSTLDYLTDPETWLQANLRIEQEFPEAIFLPGFWVEIGMTAEPSAFGCKISLYPDKTPVAHPVADAIEALESLAPPNPLTDGFMPIILNYYRRAEPRVNDAGHEIKIVAARGPLTVATHLMGVSNFLLGLKLNPAATHRLLRTTTTLVRSWLEAQAGVLKAVDGVLVLDDIAGFVSARDYLEFAHPYLKEVFSAFPRAVKIFHNDTDNPVSYPHLRDLGIHIFNFTHLQPIAKVRQLTGPNLCLMGNLGPLDILVRAQPEQVQEQARACVANHGGAQGLLLSAGGGVSPGTPGPNIAALLQAAQSIPPYA